MARWWIRRVVGIILFASAAVGSASSRALAVRPPGGGGEASTTPERPLVQSVLGYRLATLLLVVALILATAVMFRMRQQLIRWKRVRDHADPHAWASIEAGSQLES